MGIKDKIRITNVMSKVTHGRSCIRKMTAEERQAIIDEEERRKKREEAHKIEMVEKARKEEEDRKHREEEEIRKRRLRVEEEKRRIELEKLKDEEAALKREQERVEKERLEQLERTRKEEEAKIKLQKARAEAERLNTEREQRLAEEERHKVEEEQRQQLEEQRRKEEERIQLEKSKTEQIIKDNNKNLELCKKVILRLSNEISPLQTEFDTLSQNVATMNEALVKFDEGEEDRIQKQAKSRLLKKIEITERKLDTVTLKLNTLKSELSATYETKRKCDEIEYQYRRKSTRTITIPYPFLVNVDDLNRKILTIYTDSLDDHTASILESIQHAFYKIDIQPTPLDSVVTGSSHGGDESKIKNISAEEFDQKYPTCPTTKSSQGNKECEICLTPLCKNTLSTNTDSLGGNMKTLGCGHMFHAECVTPWVTKYTSSCPSCRKEV